LTCESLLHICIHRTQGDESPKDMSRTASFHILATSLKTRVLVNHKLFRCSISSGTSSSYWYVPGSNCSHDTKYSDKKCFHVFPRFFPFRFCTRVLLYFHKLRDI